MSKVIQDPSRFIIGITILVAGLILIFIGIDYENTNLVTVVNETLFQAFLLFLGFFLSGIGVLMALVGWLKRY